MAAKVLVSCTGTLLSSPRLPLGESQRLPPLGSTVYERTLTLSPVCVSGLSTTLSLWRSLFVLLQDEDQEVRDSASDFISNVPAALLRNGTHSAPARGTSATHAQRSPSQSSC